MELLIEEKEIADVDKSHSAQQTEERSSQDGSAT